MTRSICKLTEAEIKVVKSLAENGPQTGYEFHSKKDLKIISNAQWERIRKDLVHRGIIFEMSKKGDRGSKPYWLTGRGVTQALGVGADPSKTKAVGEKYFSGAPVTAIKEQCDFRISIGQKAYSAMVDMMEGEDFSFSNVLETFSSSPARVNLPGFLGRHPDYKQTVKGFLNSFLSEIDKEEGEA